MTHLNFDKDCSNGNFMYSNTLSATTPTAVLDVMMAADKFDVATYCKISIALFGYIFVADAVQDAAKQFLAQRFKDINK